MLVDAYANMFWAAAFQTCVIIHLLSASDNFMLQNWGFVFPFSPPFFKSLPSSWNNHLSFPWVWRCSVVYHRARSSTLNGLHASLNNNTGKTHTGSQGSKCMYFFGHFWLMEWGWWVIGRNVPIETAYMRNSVYFTSNQTAQSMACWEKAYPHHSLGTRQLVLRTSK